jgi:glucose/arabinose dehydrogenase
MNNTPLVHATAGNFRFRSRAAAFLIVLAAAAALPAATVPTGFTHSQIGGNLNSPTAFAIAPDGRIFVCEQGGKLRVIKNGTLLPTPFVTLTVDSVGERGLLGVAFDPNFATNKYVYVYYTATSPKHNRVSRFTANGDVALSGSQVVLLELDNLTSATNHNGGALQFGADGKLYIAVGENAQPSNAQSKANLLGKLLRLNKNGTIPTDNPFYSTTTGKNRAIWALGLRNPFTFAVQPGTGRIFINDVGQNTTEEVNEGLEGANYGWPATEGPTSNPAYETPVYAYANGTATCAITGGTFYNPPVAQFPSGYTNDYFFADYCGNWIKRLDAAGSYTGASTFATGVSRPVGLAVGPDGSLYYLARGTSSGAGGVYRIQYTQNTPPAVTVHPADQTVTVGDPVSFSVSASGTPPLSYQWQRNGVDISGSTSPTHSIASVQLAGDGAVFRCRITNAHGSVTSNGATMTVLPGLAPVAGISTPAAGTTFAGGQTISYSGTGTDPEDGTLPASAFEWEVVLHHDTHTHPFAAPTSGSTIGSFAVPTTGHTEDNIWYRIHLTVTDSDGLSHSVFRDVVPRKSTLTFTTSPSGLQILLDGQPVTTPISVVGVEGIERTLGVVSPQNKGGVDYFFASWSDGGAATHDISTPVSDTTYTATFSSTPAAGPSIPLNPSFEDGSGSPNNWTLGANAYGAWSWDASTAADGTRSAKLVVPGTSDRTSPKLTSATFALDPGTQYRLRYFMKSTGVGGSEPPAIFVVELDQSGNVLEENRIDSFTGTQPWVNLTKTFTTHSQCVSGYVYVRIPSGYGTFWVDRIRIELEP